MTCIFYKMEYWLLPTPVCARLLHGGKKWTLLRQGLSWDICRGAYASWLRGQCEQLPQKCRKCSLIYHHLERWWKLHRMVVLDREKWEQNWPNLLRNSECGLQIKLVINKALETRIGKRQNKIQWLNRYSQFATGGNYFISPAECSTRYGIVTTQFLHLRVSLSNH